MVSNEGVVTYLASFNQYIQGLSDKYWLSQSEKLISDDLFVVPGPLHIEDLPRYTVGQQRETKSVNVKCHPSRPPASTETTDDLTINPSTNVYVTVAIYNRSNTTQVLPPRIIGDLCVPNRDNQDKFTIAATDTAEQLVDNIVLFLSTSTTFYQKATGSVLTSSPPRS